MKGYFTLLSFLTLALFACDTQQKTSPSLSADVEAILDSTITVRRHLHQHPELAGNEIETKRYLENFLSQHGIELLPNVYGHGVVGVLNSGKAGKRIAWRADMDALPNNFPDEVAFQSVVEGVQHGCGHDVHMAIGLGIAAVLAQRKDEIMGQVYFIFQPEEETFLGAKNMVKNGLISKYQIEEFFALHVTALPTGTIMVKPNEMYAYQKRVKIAFIERVDPITLSNFYVELKAYLTRVTTDKNPGNLPLAFDDNLGLHQEQTIFSDYRIMDDTPYIDEEQTSIYSNIYETDAAQQTQIIPAIADFIQDSPLHSILDTIFFVQQNPTVINDEVLTKDAVSILTQHFGAPAVTMSHGQIPYFNDDFTYFQSEGAGVYFLFGGSNAAKGIVAMNHAPNFQVDEDCIGIGVERFATLLLERTKVE